MTRFQSLTLALSFALLLVVAATPIASAYTVPNLIAVGTTDGNMAITYGGNQNPQSIANAGAFASAMINGYGMVGIPNYDPVLVSGSWLVCSIPMSVYPPESIGVYGIRGTIGIAEAAYLCQSMGNDGYTVNWQPAP